MEELNKDEKKVEYLELIYDLIFVYLIGRNNSLLHHMQGGFISGGMFLTYVICTLTIIQIWNFSTFYINRYGRNGLRDHIFLFVNMYLLYYMADGIRAHWQEYFDRYNVAWALILFNIGLQYFIERRYHKAAPWEMKQIEITGTIIWIEALIVVISIPIYHIFGVTIAFAAVIFGIAATVFSGKVNDLVSVDFTHLSERAMLYVVFTFGEMIIAVAGYFEGGANLNSIYFSVMGFLIVVGLFLSYGTLYDHIIDREMTTRGTGYMMIHVFLIFALNNITTALELMREEDVELLPKTLFLIGSFLIYYIFLFMTERFAKERMHFNRKLRLALLGFAIGFVGLMLLFMRQMYANIAITVIYVFWVYSMLYRYGKHVREE